jgi:outer membrane protein OmpA-like peptidoglycan-associated protein
MKVLQQDCISRLRHSLARRVEEEGLKCKKKKEGLSVMKMFKTVMRASAAVLLTTGLAMCIEPNARVFTAGHKEKIRGVIVSHEGDTLKIRGGDESIGIIDLKSDTKIQLKRGIFRQTSDMKAESLVPGLQIEALGKGGENGDLVASKIVFDPNSLTVSRQVDARVDPVEARTGALETRAGDLESRAGQIENRESKLDEKQKQTEQQLSQTIEQVGQVKAVADQANQGVDNVNQRVNNLDNYQAKYSEAVYFMVNSSTLTTDDKQKLDNLAQQAKSEKGYAIQVAGYADRTGSAAYNQQLSDSRANAVIHYLEEHADIPINRILTPAGLGTSHEAADNRTSTGRKLNRRVEVKVLVNQGLVTASNPSENTATADLTGGAK